MFFVECFHKPLGKVAMSLMALLLLATCAARAYAGLDGMNGYSHDLFVFLDGGWRVLNGQVPYNDFFTDAGTFVHLLTALGLALAHGQAEGLAYSQALMGLIVGIWAHALVARRVFPLIGLLLVWILVLLTLSPSLIGDSPIEVTAACLYNRYGYALAALLILEAFYDARPSSPRSTFWGGFSSGAITGLLLFIKISYFLGAGFLLTALWPCRPQTRLRWTGIATGFSAVLLPTLIYMRGTLFPMLASLRLLAGAKHLSILPATLRAALFASCEMLIVSLIAVRLLRREGAIGEARRLSILSAAVLAAGLFFLLTNYQGGRVPLLPLLGLLLIQQVESRSYGTTRENLLARAAILVSCCLFVTASLLLDGASLSHALLFRLREVPLQNARFDSPKLSGFRDLESGYVLFVNDGIGLVHKHRQPADTVASLDFSNPFSYALGIAPAAGGTPTGLQYRTNFDDNHKLPPEILFGRAKLVMLPNTFTDTTLQDTIPRLYGPYLEQHFHLVGKTAFWSLYRDKD